MDIHIRDVSKRFGAFRALRDVNLDIASGELIALLGPSGSGKTTLLRAIAGLESIDAGQIKFGEEDAARLPVQGRRVGFVFQHYALFKHMTIGENVAFGLSVRDKRHRPAAAEIQRRVQELLELVQLPGLEKRYPNQLSGGQKQRVALARALAIEPRVLLLDEPFGALDAKVRKDLRRWLRALHDRTGYTTIFVTHDQEEALELADRIVVMNRGGIEQSGSVDELYEHPATPFVFDFLGSTNIIEADVLGRRLVHQQKEIATLHDSIHPNGPVDVYVRPGDLRAVEANSPGMDVFVRWVQRTGPIVRAEVNLSGTETVLTVELPHLHHDVPLFKADARLRLRMMQFSLYPRGSRLPSRSVVEPPILIGRERERARLS
ncbi:MAG TPA: sulfate ABC transporter ATP-binding protein [Nevskiaceae bacterium]|nr:sulfate ABC transporter ATP-binding protein [Nevskiaceae bacterium]